MSDSAACLFEQSFESCSYFVSWTTAKPGYDPTFRLVPVLVLSGPEVPQCEEDGLPQAKAFLQFWPSDEQASAEWRKTHNHYYFNYPITHVESVMRLVESGARFRVVYKEQDGRCWGSIEVFDRPLVRGEP